MTIKTNNNRFFEEKLMPVLTHDETISNDSSNFMSFVHVLNLDLMRKP